MDAPKYALNEIERRWRVDPERIPSLDGLPFTQIDDLYLAGGLRLRRMERPGGEVVYKLCKKYGRRGPWTEPITNLYLTLEEYCLLDALEGARAGKRRYPLAGGSLDLYSSPTPGLTVFEVEFETEAAAAAYRPPAFVTEEITGDLLHTGAALASRRAG